MERRIVGFHQDEEQHWGLCRKVALEAICAMVSPGNLWYVERESDDGDQFQGGPFPPRDHSDGRALVCCVCAP
jgi:hypothetical protein